MSSSVVSFLNATGGDIANANRYIVDFSAPNGVSDGQVDPDSTPGAIAAAFAAVNAGGKLKYYASAVSYPGASVPLFDVKLHGRPVVLPAKATYQKTISITLMIDGQWEVFNYFKACHTAVTNKKANTVNYIDDYSFAVGIQPVHRDGSLVGNRVELIDAWVSSVGEVDLAFDKSNEIALFTIGLECRKIIDT